MAFAWVVAGACILSRVAFGGEAVTGVDLAVASVAIGRAVVVIAGSRVS